MSPNKYISGHRCTNYVVLTETLQPKTRGEKAENSKLFSFKQNYFSCKQYNYLSHSTTNHFFPFHLCPIWISLTYSVRVF